MIIEQPTLDLALRTIILGPVSLLWIAVIVRIIGLRSFSKMTAFDFIATVATGSLLANAAVSSNWGEFIQSSGAVGALLATQASIAFLRVRSSLIARLFENDPLLLMENGVLNVSNMRNARVTEDDVRAKLREANVLRFSDVRAVILETTGDISVMHGKELEAEIMESVRKE